MAAGDVVSGLSSVSSGNYLSMQPAGSDEWVIHNICHDAGDFNLYFYDGSSRVLVDIHQSGNSGGGWLGLFLHCTNSRYYQVQNTEGSAKNISYDGIQTK